MFRNILNYLTYVPKKAVAIVAIALMVLTPVVATASWSPDRPVKDYNDMSDRLGFDSPVFNSFINTPSYGDERTFFDAKDASITTAGGYQNLLDVQDGQEIRLRTYIHNNANQNLNGQDLNGPGVARDSKVQIVLPSAVDKTLRATSYISASNATPLAVSDTVDFVNDTPFKLEYVPGSAEADSKAVPQGYALSDSIVTSGAPVGYTGPDGNIPGCFQYDIVVTIKVKVKMGNYSVSKKVRKEGQKDWQETVASNPGDTVEYQVAFKNTSDVKLDKVVVGDVLPKNMTYVQNSATIANGTYPNPVSLNSNNLTSGGVEIGNYEPGAAAYVMFKAKVDPIEKLECGKQLLRNKAVVQPKDNPAKEDTADVTVEKQCQPPVTPPQTPPQELPNTGIEGPLAGILGSGSMGVAIRSFIRGRRSLKDALISV